MGIAVFEAIVLGNLLENLNGRVEDCLIDETMVSLLQIVNDGICSVVMAWEECYDAGRLTSSTTPLIPQEHAFGD